MKKIFLTLFITSLLFTLFSKLVFAEEINSFNENIKINKDGTINVVEKIDYIFGQVYKHGIYRDIPYTKTNQEGKKFKLSISNISVTDENNQPYIYSQTNENNSLHLKIGDPNNVIDGEHTYVISYTIAGALTYFSDHDELYWNVTGNNWQVPINQATARVEFPETLKENDVKLACYTGATGSTSSNCSFKTDGKTADFTSNTALYSNEGMTLVIGFPKNIVATLEPQKIISFSDTLAGKLVLILLILLATLWYLVYPIWIVIKWLKAGRDPKTYRAVSSWFDPPKSKDGRFLTPGETGALYDEKVDMSDITSTIIHLAQRGYLKIEERQKKKLFGTSDVYYLIKTKETDNSLLGFEKTLIDGIFEDGDEVELKQKDSLYEAVNDAKDELYKQVVADDLFPKNPQSIRNFYTTMVVLSAITLNGLLFVASLIFGRAMSKRTLFGAEQLGIAKSLRNFLTSQERQLKFQAQKQMMFEKLLPYAVAFGVEKIWAERFKDMNLPPPAWFSSYHTGTFNAIYFASALNSSMSSFTTAATPTRSSSGFSSGFGGGGFSGGGGGGGGGGSW